MSNAWSKKKPTYEIAFCKQLGRAIRTLREEQKLSQGDLAEGAEVHRTYINEIEKGIRNPSVTTVVRIAKVLDIEPSELLRQAQEVQLQ